MKLALDARTVFRPHRRGTGKNLIDLYRRLATLRPGWEIVMFHRQGEGGANPFADLDNVQPVQIDIPGDRLNLWRELRLPLAAWRAGADVLHCPANMAPRFSPVPVVVTIHDLIGLDSRFAGPDADRWGAVVGRSARKAAAILTPSDFSAKQIERTFGVSADKITVNPWAPDGACREVTDPAELNAVRRRHGLADNQPFVLVFGGIDPRKNTARIIDAWARVPVESRKNCALLIVGVQDEAMSAFAKRVAALDLAGSCKLHGFADEADMPALLSGATVLCYASLSEGFGLPILDAFACSTPVVTSDVTSLPEVAGDAAVLVDPAKTESIADGLTRLLTEPADREELIRRGRDRLEAFSWEKTTARAVDVFEKVVHD